MKLQRLNFGLIWAVALLLTSCGSTHSLRKYDPQSDKAYIVISKEAMTLELFDGAGELIRDFDIACGKAYGNKVRPGDMKTPEGEFHISELCDARYWTHDFGDGKGERKGAYGSHFIRLHTPPHTGIGIHGTHAPKSIGTRATEGCIRLKSRKLKKLVPYIYMGMPVTIISSEKDREATEREKM